MGDLILKGIPIGSVKGVLFDKDGTLSNSEEHLQSLCQKRIHETIHRFKDGQASEEAKTKLLNLLRKAYGQATDGSVNPGGTIAIASRNDNLISTATVLCLMGESWPKAIALAGEIFAAVGENNPQNKNNVNRLLPGVREMLHSLNSNGVICALISNDSSEGIKSFIKHNHLYELLSLQYWSADNAPPKPDPNAINGLCDSLGLTPSQCAMIGDSDSDLLMAKKANVAISIGYISGWRMPPSLKETNHLINHWNELRAQSTTRVAPNMN